MNYTIEVPLRHAADLAGEERKLRDIASTFTSEPKSQDGEVIERHSYRVPSMFTGAFYVAVTRYVSRLWALGVPEVICEVDGHRVASRPEGSRWL